MLVGVACFRSIEARAGACAAGKRGRATARYGCRLTLARIASYGLLADPHVKKTFVTLNYRQCRGTSGALWNGDEVPCVVYGRFPVLPCDDVFRA